MPLLRRVVLPSVMLGAAAMLAITGCSSFDKALGQQQALVSFKDGTPNSVRLAVRTACAKVPHVKPVPLATSVPLTSALDNVVYTVTGASNANLAELQVCLSKFPSVNGLNFQDSSDAG